MNQPAVIKIKNIAKVYSGLGVKTYALKSVSFSIQAGEFVSIMGPSGSGKSTLLHILGFLDRPTKGEYFFQNISVTNYSAKKMAIMRNKKIGFVFQAFNLLPKTSVLENVILPLYYSKIKEREWLKKAKKAIAAVGLEKRLKHTPAQLSGGERQRVAIARALVNEPSIIFADEPTGNLDSANSHQIMQLLKQLNQKGHTVLIVTHEKEMAKYTHRKISLKDGTVEKDKTIANSL